MFFALALLTFAADAPRAASHAASRAASHRAPSLPAAAPTIAAASATLAGRVTDSAGTPIAQVRVTVLEAKRTTDTDADGRYTLPALPRGIYRVSFARVGYRPVIERVVLGDAPRALDVRLAPSLVELQDVQVTASPVATTALTSPQPTSIVGGAALDLSQAPTLGATLAQVPGVRNYSTGSGIGKPVIRGLSGNRVLVTANGQRIESQQWGDEHGPNIETTTAQRVEVIRGPASVLYGSDALGGVINVVEPDLPDALGRTPFVHGRLATAYGTNGHAPDGTLTLDGASGALGLRASLYGRRSGDIGTPTGALFNSGLRTLGGEAAAGLHGSWGSAHAAYSYRDERIEIHEDPADDPAATPFQDVLTQRASVGAHVPVGQARLELDGGYETNRRHEFEETAATDYVLGLLGRTYTADARFHHAPLGGLEGVLGASYLRTSVGVSGEERLVPASTSNDVGLYGYEALPVGRWQFTAGARVDHRTLDVQAEPAIDVVAQRRDWNSVTGNLGALYHLAEPLALSLNVGRGFRAPSSFDLFANGVHEGTGRFERGNPNLGVEASLNTDLGLRIQTSRLSADVGGYVNLISGYIFPDPTGTADDASGFPIYDITQGDARLVGFEAAAEYHATTWLHIRTTADYTRGTNTTTGLPLPFVPPLRVTYSAQFEGGTRGGLRDTYLRVGGETSSKQTRLDPQDFAPDGYTLAEVAGGFATTLGRNDLAVDVAVRNLFDTRYRSFLSRYKTYADDPGRSVVVRVTTAF